ncbi:MAG: hypothetical protein N0A16_02210 [Blastocatellia bacterium]|nr:hypothetical protein [Blastocatellia bacterium]MCS7156527.1 hypothetical protein [Blastocatellia bacterium]MCX7751732.1 hypothetical protein [Blastocatellia bacterium]MDW8168833.1 hypothetical protein [Acidobacteriota bacterium]MDW8257453.1 hypothetical protein [Acidobacteriota bacterium]
MTRVWYGIVGVSLVLSLPRGSALWIEARDHAPRGHSSQASSTPSSQKPPTPSSAEAQRSQEKREPESASRDPLTDPEQELLDRAAIEHRKAEHRRAVEASEQLLKRARELSEQWEKRHHSRRSEELLQEIERFARRIRSISGAGDLSPREPLPEDPARALARLRESAERLHDAVKALTAYVISVEVMERADEIVRLARYLRQHARTDRGT